MTHLIPRISTLFVHPRFVVATAALAVMAGASPAVAQDDSATDERARVEERLEVEDAYAHLPTSNTIATKLPMEQSWTPANIGAVDSVLIDEQHALVLGDALSNISGINVQTGSGVFDFFVLRGFDSLNSGLILSDGAPEPETSFYQLYDVERVEVLKGPAGFLYGSNPLAGVVNLVTKQPEPQSFARLGLAGGSFGTQEARLDVNRSNIDGDSRLRLNGLWRESDGHRDGRDQEVRAFHPGFACRPDERTAVTVNLELASSDYRPDAGLPVLGGEVARVPRDRSYASPLDSSQQDVTRAQIDFERELGPSMTLRNKLYLRELDWQTRGTLLSGVFEFGTGPQVFRTLFELDDRQRFAGNQLEVLARSERHHLMAGVEYGSYTDVFSLDALFLPTIDLFRPVETPNPVLFPIPGQAATGDTETTIIAPYFTDQILLSDRARLLVGARYDSIEFDDAASGTSRSDGELSPMLGLVYAPGAATTVYANAARSFAPASPRVVGDREPEESSQVEVGVRRHFAGGKLRGVLAAFQLDRDNIAIPDDNGFTQQAGDQRSRGLELEFGGDFGNGVSGTFAYAYTDAELTRFSELVQFPQPPFFFVFDRSGNVPAFAPEHLLSGWLSRAFESGLRVSGGVTHVGAQFIAEDNATEVASYTLLGAGVSYDFTRWRLSLDLDNLTDEEYDTRGFGSFSVIPGAPLSANLRVEFRM